VGIITISRGTKSGGILLAEAIGRRMGVTVLCRESLIDRNRLLADMERELGEKIVSLPPYMYDTLRPLRDAYLALFRAELLEHAARGPIVYHSNGGQLVLGGLPGLLRTRVIAPLGMRLDLVVDRLGCTRLEASKYIHEKDEGRTRWNRFLYGVESLRDELYYDLVVNLENLEADEAAALVESVAALEPFSWDNAGRREVQDAALAARIEAALTAHPNTRMVEARVTAADGVVTITGDLEDLEAMREEIERLADDVEGVAAVHLAASGEERG
jgi:osmotically-inducible protein OsmY